MNKYLIAFLMTCLVARVFPSGLEVGEMSMEGNIMSLSGGVEWNHPMGKIQVKSAEVRFNQNRSWEYPEEIVMQEWVDIALEEGSVLKAPYGCLRCRQWMGIFHGHEGEKIRYERLNPPSSLQALRLEMQFVPPTKDHKVLVDKIIAEDSVEISWNESSTYLAGDRVVFDRFSPKGVFGRAVLLSDGINLCLLTQDQDEIQSKKIELDLTNNTATLQDPQGLLRRVNPPLKFLAKEMVIEKVQEKIHLVPPITIDWMGTITSQGRVEMKQKANQLASIDFQGPVKLVWKNPQDLIEHRLSSFGPLYVDLLLKKITIESLKNGNENEQVHFVDSYGEIFADQVVLTYKEQEGRLDPIDIVFEGNIRLQNRMPGSQQYALADEAHFIFEKNSLALRAKERPRVLFYDELNKVQASAPGLTINRDIKTGQDIVKGLGNVRFIFAEEELNELKKRFSFETIK